MRPSVAGAEACFTAGEHIATIARRLARVDTIEPTDPASTAAATFVATRLRPAWTQVHTRLVAHLHQAGIALEAPTASCLSPSDFGFHNALVDGQRIGFLDFEYAGRDDPAKLVCDFFAQPELPAPAALFNTFVARLVAGLGLNDQDAARCHALRAAYRVKWACILLNEFLPRDAARREFADRGASGGAPCQPARTRRSPTDGDRYRRRVTDGLPGVREPHPQIDQA